MQNNYKTIGAMAAVSALVAGNALAGTAPMTTSAPAAAESSIQYQLATGYTSEYLFRGGNLGTDLVEVSAKVSGELAGFNLSGGAWYGSFKSPVDGFDGYRADTDELDIFAEVSKDLGFLTASVGYIYYAYDQANGNEAFNYIEDTQEVYFGLSRDLGFATVYATYYWDIVGDGDGYTEAGLSRSFELGSCLTLNVASNVSYFVEPGIVGSWTTKVSLDYAFAEKAKISPFVATSIALEDKVDTFTEESKNQLVGGVMLSVGF